MGKIAKSCDDNYADGKNLMKVNLPQLLLFMDQQKMTLCVHVSACRRQITGVQQR